MSVCKEVLEIIERYTAGVALPAELRRLESHVSGCSACRHAIEEEQALNDLIRRAADADVESADRLLARIRERLDKETP